MNFYQLKITKDRCPMRRVSRYPRHLNFRQISATQLPTTAKKNMREVLQQDSCLVTLRQQR